MTDSSGKSVIVNATLVARAHFMARRTLVNDSSCHLWTQSVPVTIKFPTTQMYLLHLISSYLKETVLLDLLDCCFYSRMMSSFYYFITFTTTHLPPTSPSFSLLLHIIALHTRQPAR